MALLSVKVKVQRNAAALARAAEKGNNTALRRAGAYVRGMAMRGIRTSQKPSEPGAFPRTRKGRLRKAILFAVEERGVNVIIGPSAGAIGQIGATHEFGGTEPPKKKRGRRGGFKLEIGGHGPMRVIGAAGDRDKSGRFLTQKARIGVGKIFTGPQLSRAKALAATLPPADGGTWGQDKPRVYPKRPFMRPTLDRALAERKIPGFWYSTIRS